MMVVSLHWIGANVCVYLTDCFGIISTQLEGADAVVSLLRSTTGTGAILLKTGKNAVARPGLPSYRMR